MMLGKRRDDLQVGSTIRVECLAKTKTSKRRSSCDLATFAKGVYPHDDPGLAPEVVPVHLSGVNLFPPQRSQVGTYPLARVKRGQCLAVIPVGLGLMHSV